MKLIVLLSFIPAAVFVPTVLTVAFLRQREKSVAAVVVSRAKSLLLISRLLQ